MDEQTVKLLEENKRLKDELRRMKMYAKIYKEDAERIAQEHQNLIGKLRTLAAMIDI